jgi:3-deoxy-D-manno-octulosonic-acid transferase
VPRHPERFDAVAKLLDASNIPWQRRSQLGAGVAGVERSEPPVAPLGARLCLDPSHPRVLLVDTIGELGAWWGTATMAFVGGSFGSRGGQNMIEPAAYGAAVSFGPNTRNFRDIVAALRADDAAVVVQDADELEAFVRRCLDESEYAVALGDRAQQLVRSQLGATSRTVALIELLLTNTTQQQSRRSAA